MAQRRGKKLVILVVQQEEYERERMVSLLKKGSIEVRAAKDGAEGLAMIEDFEPDILVTDIALHKLDGIELIEQGLAHCPEMKVVVAFGPYSPKHLVKAVEIGVSAFVRLPAEEGELRTAVMKCARDITMARRMAEADYSLKQLLDFFPGPAILVDGLNVTYHNRPLAVYLGYENHESMSVVDAGLEDFIVKINGESYDGHPQHWIESIVEDQLDRDHVVQIENPRHPDGRPNTFGVTFNQFPGSDLRLFSFQDISGLEDERAHLEDEASTDPLTKALNRRSFMRKLGQMTAGADTFSLVMFDIDHFKSINDTYGHDIGDAVLREISQLVRDNIRSNDTLARWGGEEFMVLSAKTTKERATRLAERLRSAVADFSFTESPSNNLSFGVAIHVSGEDAEELIKRADEALYEAKETGRNKVVLG